MWVKFYIISVQFLRISLSLIWKLLCTYFEFCTKRHRLASPIPIPVATLSDPPSLPTYFAACSYVHILSKGYHYRVPA